ncbi:hypothetical protein GCM10027039_29000 [Terrabacter koreensis]
MKAWTPSPAGAVVEKIQVVLGVVEVCRPSATAPVTATHFVSVPVTTVSVRAPPCFAKRPSPVDTVPAPPLNEALVIGVAKVGATLTPPITTPETAAPARSRRATPPAPRLRRGCAPCGALLWISIPGFPSPNET